MKVLIVEDEKYIVEGLKKMIPWEELGFRELGVAYDGEEGWELFCKEEPDFLLTDIYMPKMNGLELIKRVRRIDKDLPVIILSGYEEFEYAREAIELDVNKYILKPALYTEITEIIQECIYEWEKKHRNKLYLEEFKDQLDKDLPVLRKEFLSDMVSFGLSKRDFSKQRLRFLELDPAIVSGGLVMSLKLHRSKNEKTRSEKDWQLLKFAAKNIAQEIVEFQNRGYVLRYMEDRLQILLVGMDKDEVVENAKKFANQLITNINHFLDLDVNIGIGRWYESAEQYPLSEKESRDMLLMSDYEGYQKSFYVEDDLYKHREFDRQLPKYPLQQVREMCQAFLRRDRDSVMAQWLQIERKLLQAPHAPVAYLYSVCIGILNSLYLYLIENDPSLVDSNFVIDLQSKEQLTTANELVTWMQAQLSELLHDLDEFDNLHRFNGYVDYVKKIVHERYDENISFSEIAKELHLSRNYLSNLFKREVGESFRDYLTNYRIEKAKELIDTNRYMLYEIAEMVGYPDQNYFSRIFKKSTGISPTEYKMGVKTS